MPFTRFDPLTDTPSILTDALTGPASGLTISNPTFSGGVFPDLDGLTNFTGAGSASVYDGSIQGLGIDAGILLTSGDGAPPLENTEGAFGEPLFVPADPISFDPQPGDSDLDVVAASAFPGSGETNDATVLEFDLTAPANAAGIRFDLVFGSEEFPEFSDTDFVDVAGVFVNGVNQALFNGQANQPLSVTQRNIDLNAFRDNTDSGTANLGLEYDGISSVTTIQAPIQAGTNRIKIAIADTGDQAFDSGLFLANLEATSTGGGGLLINVNGTDGDDTLTGSDDNEFLKGGTGNDTIDPGGGNDVVSAGEGDDTIFGGTGDNNIDGGPGTDTVVYDGPLAAFPVKVGADGTVTVGSSTDTLVDVETLEFSDQTVAVGSLSDDGELPEAPEAIQGRLFLSQDGTVNVANPLEVFGRTGGNETVLIEPDAGFLQFDANIERVDLPETFASYSFGAGGTGFTVSLDGSTVFRLPSANQEMEFRFADGSTSLTQTGAARYDLGGATIDQSDVTPSIQLDDTGISLTAASAATTSLSDADGFA